MQMDQNPIYNNMLSHQLSKMLKLSRSPTIYIKKSNNEKFAFTLKYQSSKIYSSGTHLKEKMQVKYPSTSQCEINTPWVSQVKRDYESIWDNTCPTTNMEAGIIIYFCIWLWVKKKKETSKHKWLKITFCPYKATVTTNLLLLLLEI